MSPIIPTGASRAACTTGVISRQTGGVEWRWPVTSETLLDEALEILDRIEVETDPAKIKQLDGRLVAIQEVMIKKQKRKNKGVLSG